jgi:regulator of protease activity HflC (stomatin/prohibitin superfamily)
MHAFEDQRPRRGPTGGLADRLLRYGLPGILLLVAACVVAVMVMYNSFKIEVGTGEQAVLIRLNGLDLSPEMELAPPPKAGAYYKGVQAGGPNNGVLTEGRYFYNPYLWNWEVIPQFVVPQGKIGIRVSLVGADLPAGRVLAEPGQKGIIRGDALKPGRYPYNPYAESIETHDPVTIPAGFRGVLTLLAGNEPKDPNVFLVEPGERGVQTRTLEPGTYFLNPYETQVNLIDCRSQRFNLGDESGGTDFLSADGFPVSIDGAVEFRVLPERAAEVFVKYNEDHAGVGIKEQIINKIITPESRSICRIGGSRLTGGQFISGTNREVFQRELIKSLTENCKKQGVEILAVAITSIQPPEEIATPVRQREVAKQERSQFVQERLQQVSEAQLMVQQVLADQKRLLVEAEQLVVQKTTKAEEEQQVAVTLAEQQLAVSKTKLEATVDQAAAIRAKAEADAEVIRYNNKAELAGLAARVQAFGGDGAALAQNILVGKLAPAFRSIMSNSEGPLMDLFGQFTAATTDRAPRTTPASKPPTDSPQAAAGADSKPESKPEVKAQAELPKSVFSNTREMP